MLLDLGGNTVFNLLYHRSGIRDFLVVHQVFVEVGEIDAIDRSGEVISIPMPDSMREELQETDIGDRRNQLLVAVSVGFGLIPVVRPEFFAQMPQWMEPITHSGIAMATVSALVLNVLFNILGGADRAVHNEACHQH